MNLHGVLSPNIVIKQVKYSAQFFFIFCLSRFLKPAVEELKGCELSIPRIGVGWAEETGAPRRLTDLSRVTE